MLVTYLQKLKREHRKHKILKEFHFSKARTSVKVKLLLRLCAHWFLCSRQEISKTVKIYFIFQIKSWLLYLQGTTETQKCAALVFQ